MRPPRIRYNPTYQEYLRYMVRSSARRRREQEEEKQNEIANPEEEITAESMMQFAERARKAVIISNITMDETKYITDNYKSKMSALDAELGTTMKSLWVEVPPPHLRLEYANVVSFIVTFYEVFSYVDDTMEVEEGNIPCDLIDKFESFMQTLRQCRRNGCFDFTKFAYILELCDGIVECLQNHYRIKVPIKEGREPSFPKENCDRYSPYDYEWLSGSVISGPYYLKCVKYLCNTRIAQLHINSIRSHLICAFNGANSEYIGNIRVPLPTDPECPKLLAKALITRETCLKECNTKMIVNLDADAQKCLEYAYIREDEDLSHLRTDLRRKKGNVTDMLIRADRESCKSLLFIIGALSAVEGQLLILQKVLAPFYDKKLGMYGRVFPRSVLSIVWKVYISTTVDNCRGPVMNQEIRDLLKDLRQECRSIMKEFYLVHEEEHENYYTEQVAVDLDSEASFVYDIDFEDFPAELAHHAKPMIRNLYWEQFELLRLNLELSRNRQGHFDWPLDPGYPPFKMNTCNHDIVAFHCNLTEGVDSEVISKIAENTIPIEDKLRADYFLGFEILRLAHEAIERSKCVPSIAHLNQTFITHFKSALGQDVVEELSAEDMANQISEIIISDIELLDLRSKYKNVKGSLNVAKQLAKACVNTFTEYQKTHEMFLKQKGCLPKRSSRIQQVDSNGNEGEASGSSSPTEAEMVMLQNAFTLARTDEASSVASLSKIYEDLHNVFARFEQVPDELIDVFLDNVVSIDFRGVPDLSAPHYNMPLD